MDVNFIFYKCQSNDENDKGLLVGRPVASRPDKYVGLDLTLIGYIETSVVYTSRIMRRIGMMQVTRP